MESISRDNFDEALEEEFENIFEQNFKNNLYSYGEHQKATKPKKKRAYVDKNCEQGHI